jgi:glutathione S-transferase
MSNTANITDLSLYQSKACPLCARTRIVLDKLPLKIEHKDIMLNPKYRIELIKQGGLSKVPCLRIENSEGEVEWLYESINIIKYAYTLTQA